MAEVEAQRADGRSRRVTTLHAVKIVAGQSRERDETEGATEVRLGAYWFGCRAKQARRLATDAVNDQDTESRLHLN